MRLLSSQELVDFIQARQAKSVHRLKQSAKIDPRLAIIILDENPASKMHLNVNTKYAQAIGVNLSLHHNSISEIADLSST